MLNRNILERLSFKSSVNNKLANCTTLYYLCKVIFYPFHAYIYFYHFNNIFNKSYVKPSLFVQVGIYTNITFGMNFIIRYAKLTFYEHDCFIVIRDLKLQIITVSFPKLVECNFF